MIKIKDIFNNYILSLRFLSKVVACISGAIIGFIIGGWMGAVTGVVIGFFIENLVSHFVQQDKFKTN